LLYLSPAILLWQLLFLDITMIQEIAQDIDTVLAQRFGFGQFQPGQREVIEALLAGHSAAAVFTTGGG
jgi:superfamily II DNA helicase RecQ